MRFRGYAAITKEEFLQLLEDEGGIDIFTTLDELLEAHGIYSDYIEVEYNYFEDISDN